MYPITYIASHITPKYDAVVLSGAFQRHKNARQAWYMYIQGWIFRKILWP